MLSSKSDSLNHFLLPLKFKNINEQFTNVAIALFIKVKRRDRFLDLFNGIQFDKLLNMLIFKCNI